jgi:two-component system, NarL family, sensor histidine kinase ComP
VVIPSVFTLKGKYPLEDIQKLKDLLTKIEKLSNDGELETKWLVGLLFKLSETERSILAADIHDTVLQDLLLLKRNCEKLYSFDLSIRLDEEIKKIEEGILNVIYLIRETCNDFRPPFLAERGLEDSLQDLVNKFQLRSNSRLELYISSLNDRVNGDYELAIYRIIQEWLNNAMKHAKASYIEIQVNSNNEGIELFYKDDGIGMNINNTKSNSSIGIFGIKERVRSLGGKYKIESEYGNGVTYTIKFPLVHLLER